MDDTKLWSIHFSPIPSSSGKFGGGVVVMENGVIRGGDSDYYYSGTYTINNNQFDGTVTVKNYSGQYNHVLQRGIKDSVYSVKGDFDTNEFETIASSTDGQLKVTFENYFDILAG